MIRRACLSALLCLALFALACAQAPQERKAIEESLRPGKTTTATPGEAGH